jgi:hypothetical protein
MLPQADMQRTKAAALRLLHVLHSGSGLQPAANCMQPFAPAAAELQVVLVKVLKGLPRFRCLPEARGQHLTTTHLLPDKHMLKALTCCCLHCLRLRAAAASQVNLALKGLPRFRCLPEAHGQHRTPAA